MDLSHLKVLDLSTVLAGPSVGMFLAELGAQVIKFEHPKHRDVTRSWKLPIEDADTSVSAYFSAINYKKEYAQLDLKNPDDLAMFYAEVKTADIVISNFKKGDDVKFKITDEILQKLNPKLIIAKITGYGLDSHRVAYDLILQAESGFMSINGTPESGPIKMPVALIDVLAAHHLKEAILLALYNRAINNKGASVSVSLYDAAVSSLVNQASNFLMTHQVPKPIGSLHPNIAPYGEIFTTADQQKGTFAIGSDTHFTKLCNYLGLAELAQDDRFSTNKQRVINRVELAEQIKAKIKLEMADSLAKAMQELNIPFGIIKSIDKVLEAPEAQHLIREEIIEGIPTQRIASKLFTWK